MAMGRSLSAALRAWMDSTTARRPRVAARPKPTFRIEGLEGRVLLDASDLAFHSPGPEHSIKLSARRGNIETSRDDRRMVIKFPAPWRSVVGRRRNVPQFGGRVTSSTQSNA